MEQKLSDKIKFTRRSGSCSHFRTLICPWGRSVCAGYSRLSSTA